MTKEELEKQIAILRAEQSKLYKVKSASPKEIADRVSKISRRIQQAEEKLRNMK